MINDGRRIGAIIYHTAANKYCLEACKSVLLPPGPPTTVGISDLTCISPLGRGIQVYSHSGTGLFLTVLQETK
jgi:hypothetical protein